MRWLLGFLSLALIVAPTPVHALMAAPKSTLQKVASSDAILVGKITAIEKETVELAPFPGSPNKLAYKIAVVQVKTPITGTENITHVKIAFLPRPAPKPAPVPNPGLQPVPIRPRPGILAPELKLDDEFLFFLVKHPDGNFYAMPSLSPPLAIEGDESKKTIENVKQITAALADPMKGLKSTKPEDRFLTAAAVLTRYRTYPDFASKGVDQEPIPAAESQLILKGLLDGDWLKVSPDGSSPVQLFFSLGLTKNDGWVMPKPQAGMNFNALIKDEFTRWLEGPGKDYQIKRIVAKK